MWSWSIVKWFTITWTHRWLLPLISIINSYAHLPDAREMQRRSHNGLFRPFVWGDPKQNQLLHMASIAVTLFYCKSSDEAKMSLTKTKKKKANNLFIARAVKFRVNLLPLTTFGAEFFSLIAGYSCSAWRHLYCGTPYNYMGRDHSWFCW